MIAALLAVLASQAAVSSGSDPVELSGRCQYSDAIARFSQEASLILCDSLVIDRAEATAAFDFRQRSWGSMVRFAGQISGDRMTITRVYPRHRSSAEATGTCDILYRDGTTSAVSCLARAGSKTYVANFVRSRL
jgi:hypothetical protein